MIGRNPLPAEEKARHFGERRQVSSLGPAIPFSEWMEGIQLAKVVGRPCGKVRRRQTPQPLLLGEAGK